MLQKICLFGDSITWGAWDTENGGWGYRLRNYLEISDDDYSFIVYNCGVSGDTTNELLKRLNFECESRKPNLIIYAIGINDSFYYKSKDKPNVSIDKFQNNLQELINQAKKFKSKIIFVGLTPVDESKTTPISWDVDIYNDQENTILYNNKIKEVSEKNNIPFIDMLSLLNIKDLEDGLHPNSQGHEKMFLKIRDFLVSNKFV